MHRGKSHGQDGDRVNQLIPNARLEHEEQLRSHSGLQGVRSEGAGGDTEERRERSDGPCGSEHGHNMLRLPVRCEGA